MGKLSLEEQLDIAIKAAARDAEPHVTSREVAAEWYRSEPELFAPFLDVWVTEKLASLIAKHRTAIRRASNPQLELEGLLGFAHLPKKLTLRSGDRVKRSEATIKCFRRHRGALWKASHPGLDEVDRAIALMEKYIPENRSITWGEVVQREAENAKSMAAAG